MQLFYPSCTSIFYGWIKEDYLVLYPNLVHNGFYSHAALNDLEGWVRNSFEQTTDYIPSPLSHLYQHAACC